MINNYYVRATGDNRFAGGGTSRWLRIRGIIEREDGYLEVEVSINGQKKYVALNNTAPNLEFSKGIWPNAQPCSWLNVKKGYGYGLKL